LRDTKIRQIYADQLPFYGYEILCNLRNYNFALERSAVHPSEESMGGRTQNSAAL